jgi:hypothetical protein
MELHKALCHIHGRNISRDWPSKLLVSKVKLPGHMPACWQQDRFLQDSAQQKLALIDSSDFGGREAWGSIRGRSDLSIQVHIERPESFLLTCPQCNHLIEAAGKCLFLARPGHGCIAISTGLLDLRVGIELLLARSVRPPTLQRAGTLSVLSFP